MQTCITRLMRADLEVVFSLAASVEDWPQLLPHYRWVRVLGERDGQRLVEMAARRDVLAGLGIPLWWRAIETPDLAGRRIGFQHVAGLTRGMQVAWELDPRADGYLEVSIRHAFRPRWPVPDPLLEAIVGEYFVNGVARRTLDHLARLAERRQKRA